MNVCLSFSQTIGRERGAMLKVFTITQRLIEIDFGLIGCWYAHRLQFFLRNGGNIAVCVKEVKEVKSRLLRRWDNF